MPGSSWAEDVRLKDALSLLKAVTASKKFSEAVLGLPLLSTWSPPSPTEFDMRPGPESTKEDPFLDESKRNTARHFVQELHIPNTKTKELPALLLHRLGSFTSDERLKQRVDDLFSGKNTFLHNASGSGKTRLVSEGLCHEWGLYLTSVVDSSVIGSSDVQTTVTDSLHYADGFVFNPSSLPDQEAKQKASHNMQMLNARLNFIILSRLLVFRAFLDRANELGGVTYEHRKRWLHFQLQPDVQAKFNGTDKLQDVFHDICTALWYSNVDQAVLNIAITETMEAIMQIITDESRRMYIVLDEANVLFQKYKYRAAFGGPPFQPLVKAILTTWREQLKDVVFVVSGTQIPSESFVNDPEYKDFVWSSNTGGFTNTRLQEAYVRELVPIESMGPAGKKLTDRIWKWMRGRHRFTSAYLSVLLEHSFIKPFTYADLVIKAGTGYSPNSLHDYDTGKLDDSDTRPPIPSVPFGLLSFVLMLRDKLLRSCVHLALVDALIARKNPGYTTSYIGLVNEGMGRFADALCSQIVVDEPLVIVRAVTWFTNDEEGEGIMAYLLKYQYFLDHLVTPNMPPRHPPAYLVVALSLAFGGGPRVSDLVTFYPRRPQWSDLDAQIVTRQRRGAVPADIPLKNVDRKQQTLVTYCTSMAETLSWIRHEQHTPFCIHIADDTATLLFLLKFSDKTRLWIALRAVHSVPDTEDINSVIRDTAKELQSETLFADVDDSGIAADIREALSSLPNPASLEGSHILPVIAVLGNHDLSKLNSTTNKKTAPFAILNMDEMSKALEIIPQEKVAERIVEAAVSNWESMVDDVVTDEPEVKEPKPRKEKGKAKADSLSVPVQTKPKRGGGASVGEPEASGASRYNLRPRTKRKTK